MMMPTARAAFAAALLCALVTVSTPAAAPRAQSTPQQAVDELLAADRAFASAAAAVTPVAAIRAMLANDAIMPLPGGAFARGAGAIADAMGANPDNLSGHLTWAPVRGGVSADAQHGFTFGFMSLVKPDGATVPLKYMTYWVRGASGWRAVAYKRARRPEGAIATTLMPPALPAAIIAPVPVTEAMRQDLAAAELAFSNEAQKIGLGPAFAKFGLPDAVNFGGGADANFVVGADAIATLVGGGEPAGGSSVSWSCDIAIVASSGDLGVSIGLIRPNATPGSAPAPGSAFFTIWRKVNGAWKYIAE